MADYWKSTPKYWCKHCATYVRDTKLERANHEATWKHENAIKRSLRDLHRAHDREEADKERAKREVARLNSVVGSTGGPAAGPSGTVAAAGDPAMGRSSQKPIPAGPRAAATADDRKRQMEELADMGVAIPTQLRRDMALAGEWTVVSTKVVDEEGSATTKIGTGHNGDGKAESRAAGVRKREQTEEEKEEEDAVRGLFKKPKRWGRDSRTVEEEDPGLDALLGDGGQLLGQPAKEEVKAGVKAEKWEKGEDEGAKIKLEDADGAETAVDGLARAVKPEAGLEALALKKEDGLRDELDGSSMAVLFKKRKQKNTRQK